MTSIILPHNFENPPKAIRDGFQAALLELGQENEKIVVVVADVSESVRADKFAHQYPKRYFEVGVAEQNMAGLAAGLALTGYIPFIASFAAFSPGRNYDQIRVSIAYNQSNVKIAGHHSGITTGEDGAAHQMLEDIALMRTLPNMTVIVPADAEEARKATIAAARVKGPVYVRYSRPEIGQFTTTETPFRIGSANVYTTGEDVAIIACGDIFDEVWKSYHQLNNRCQITIVNLHTIKPLDGKTLLKIARHTKAIVTVEDHQIFGGMGSAVSEFLAEHCPVPVIKVGVRDEFGQSGTAKELIDHYQLDANSISQAVEKALSLKNAS